MSEPRVVIIIPSYNGVDVAYKGQPVLKHCLGSLKKTAYKNYAILVSDDCSTDSSVEYIKKNWHYVNITRRKKNGGYAENANTGLKYALANMKFDYAVMMNNDIIITEPDWLSKLIRLAESDHKIGIIGCNLTYPNGKTQGNVIHFKDRFSLRTLGKSETDAHGYKSVREAKTISGAIQVINKKTIDKIGIMDTNFINGYDDEDYCIRARRTGFKLVYDGKVSAIHLQNLTLRNTNSKVSTPSNRVYNNARNGFYFLRKHRTECGYFRLPIWYCIYFLRAFISIGGQNGESDFSKIGFSSRFWFNIKSVTRAMVDSFRLQIRQ